jgi:hypothetical protein
LSLGTKPTSAILPLNPARLRAGKLSSLSRCVANRIYLIYEVNCYLGQPSLADRVRLKLGVTRSAPIEGFASIWIANNEPDISDYETDAVKLAGPLSSEDADRYLKQVRGVLESAGLEVVEETVADD